METHPLARWRKAHKRTLNQLAEAAGCATSHLSQIESGKTNPSLKLIAKLQTITKGAIDASHFMPTDSAPTARSHVNVGKVKFGNDLPLSICDRCEVAQPAASAS
jgi:transcriptional regulator with XRE-family HTH domain